MIYSGGGVSSPRQYPFVLALLCALPLWAGVEEDWKDLYSQALHAVAAKDYPKAEGLYAKALHDAEIFGKDDVRVGSTLEGLANLQRAEKKPAEAEVTAPRAVTIYSVDPGDDSLEYADVQFALASILMDEGKYEAALQAIQKVLPLYERKLGPNSPGMADSTCIQGDAYRQLKQYASAETSLNRCADLRDQNGGVASAEFGEAANSLAIVYQHLGQVHGGRPVFFVCREEYGSSRWVFRVLNWLTLWKRTLPCCTSWGVTPRRKTRRSWQPLFVR